MSAASNYACESVQRSAGASPKYLYAPAPEGTAETVGNSSLIINLAILNNTATQIQLDLPAGANGVYLLDAVCVTNAIYSCTSIGTALETAPNVFVLTGFDVTKVAGTVGSPITALSVVTFDTNTAGQLNVTQNSGGTLVFNLKFTQIATLTAS